MLGFTTLRQEQAIYLPSGEVIGTTSFTAAEQLAAKKLEEQVLSQMPAQTTVTAWLSKYKVWIITGSAMLFGIAILGGGKRR